MGMDVDENASSLGLFADVGSAAAIEGYCEEEPSPMKQRNEKDHLVKKRRTRREERTIPRCWVYEDVEILELNLQPYFDAIEEVRKRELSEGDRISRKKATREKKEEEGRDWWYEKVGLVCFTDEEEEEEEDEAKDNTKDHERFSSMCVMNQSHGKKEEETRAELNQLSSCLSFASSEDEEICDEDEEEMIDVFKGFEDDVSSYSWSRSSREKGIKKHEDASHSSFLLKPSSSSSSHISMSTRSSFRNVFRRRHAGTKDEEVQGEREEEELYLSDFPYHSQHSTSSFISEDEDERERSRRTRRREKTENVFHVGGEEREDGAFDALARLVLRREEILLEHSKKFTEEIQLSMSREREGGGKGEGTHTVKERHED